MIGYILGVIASCAVCLFLHINQNCSFPKPLSENEERECFQKMKGFCAIRDNRKRILQERWFFIDILAGNALHSQAMRRSFSQSVRCLRYSIYKRVG